MSACYESIADPKVLQGVAGVFAGLLSEGWSDAFKDRGWATTEAIQQMSAAWLRFPTAHGSLCAGAWCEVLAQKDSARNEALQLAAR
jgi:hypothetical protein